MSRVIGDTLKNFTQKEVDRFLKTPYQEDIIISGIFNRISFDFSILKNISVTFNECSFNECFFVNDLKIVQDEKFIKFTNCKLNNINFSFQKNSVINLSFYKSELNTCQFIEDVEFNLVAFNDAKINNSTFDNCAFNKMSLLNGSLFNKCSFRNTFFKQFNSDEDQEFNNFIGIKIKNGLYPTNNIKIYSFGNKTIREDKINNLELSVIFTPKDLRKAITFYINQKLFYLEDGENGEIEDQILKNELINDINKNDLLLFLANMDALEDPMGE